MVNSFYSCLNLPCIESISSGNVVDTIAATTDASDQIERLELLPFHFSYVFNAVLQSDLYSLSFVLQKEVLEFAKGYFGRNMPMSKKMEYSMTDGFCTCYHISISWTRISIRMRPCISPSILC